MTNKLILGFLAVAFLFLQACEKTEDGFGQLNLEYQLTYDGTPVSIFDEITHEETPLFFDKFKLFTSNIDLLDGNDEVTPLADAAFLDFDNPEDENASPGTYVVEFRNIEAKTYNLLNLGIGLSPTLNATQPSDYTASHPLASHYWEQWSSYIYMILEGKADFDGDGMKTDVLTYHIGNDEAFSTKLFTKEINIQKDKTTTLQLTVDLKTMLQGIDIVAFPKDHSVKPEVFDVMVQNMNQAITMQ